MADKDVEVTKGKRSDITVVAQDKNWRSYISNELNCAERWHHDWGFLQGGAIEEGKEPVPKSREERLEELQAKFNEMKSRDFVTASQSVGRGANLEQFSMNQYNIQKAPDLMPCPRRPPKKS